MLADFRKLLDDLPAIRAQVAVLESPNPGDDRMVKFAIIGYSYSQPIDAWGRDELEFVTVRRREVADFDPRWVEFVCAASGYVLGMVQAGKYTDIDRTLFESQLPGFMWLHSQVFTA